MTNSAALAKIGVAIWRFSDDQLLKYPDAVAQTIYDHLTSEVPT